MRMVFSQILTSPKLTPKTRNNGSCPLVLRQ
nr:MAG TPA: hypothetical protein [Caudoviricetes sp.]